MVSFSLFDLAIIFYEWTDFHGNQPVAMISRGNASIYVILFIFYFSLFLLFLDFPWKSF